tara:strand:- start:73 stop:561 length:489 start_codon:yes stop_codon:yes gene_type:complete
MAIITLNNNSLSGLNVGKVLQVKSVNYSTAETITATSFTATGLSLAITPASSSNKILIICSPHIRMDRNADNAAYKVALYRDSTAIMEDDATNAYFAEFAGTTTTDIRTKQSYEFLDSPSSTSSITYKLYIANQDASSSGQVQLNWNDGNLNSSLTLMEISA